MGPGAAASAGAVAVQAVRSGREGGEGAGGRPDGRGVPSVRRPSEVHREVTVGQGQALTPVGHSLRGLEEGGAAAARAAVSCRLVVLQLDGRGRCDSFKSLGVTTRRSEAAVA